MKHEFDSELAEWATTLPVSDLADVDAARTIMASLVAGLARPVDVSTLTVDDRTTTATAENPAVPVRVYRPTADPPPAGFAALLYIHGGGFVMGSVDTEHAGAAQLARELGIVVVSVEYGLAPEHPFPAGIEDCYQALCWLHEQTDELGVDRGRVGVFGQSAGGGLAAGLALLARDRGGPALCLQFLGIPELDDRLDTPSMRAFVDTPLWNRPNAELSWQYYLGESTGDVSPYAAPARATDLRGLPPAYVSTMEFDPLRDEGIIYALRMLEAGVSVELHQFPGTFHGSGVIATASVSKRQHVEQMEVLRRRLHVDRP